MSSHTSRCLNHLSTCALQPDDIRQRASARMAMENSQRRERRGPCAFTSTQAGSPSLTTRAVLVDGTRSQPPVEAPVLSSNTGGRQTDPSLYELGVQHSNRYGTSIPCAAPFPAAISPRGFISPSGPPQHWQTPWDHKPSQDHHEEALPSAAQIQWIPTSVDSQHTISASLSTSNVGQCLIYASRSDAFNPHKLSIMQPTTPHRAFINYSPWSSVEIDSTCRLMESVVSYDHRRVYDVKG